MQESTGEGGERLTANPDNSFVTAVCDFGVVSPPICKSDNVMVLASAVTGLWIPGLPSWIVNRSKLTMRTHNMCVVRDPQNTYGV